MTTIRRLRSRSNEESKSTNELHTEYSTSPTNAFSEDTFEVITDSDVAKLCGVTKKPSPIKDSISAIASESFLKSKNSLNYSFGDNSSDIDGTTMVSPQSTWNSEDEKKVFEEQLNLLHEQLMIVMIENQTLQNELDVDRNKTELERVRAELAYERHRCKILQREIGGSGKRHVKKRRSYSDVQHRDIQQQSQIKAALGDGSSDSLEELGYPQPDGTEKKPEAPKKPGPFSVLWSRLKSRVNTFLEDFVEETEDDIDMRPETPLTVKTLKENIKRLGAGIKPYINTVKGIHELVTWKSPRYTFLVFLIYMYSAWKGWSLQVLLFCFTFRLYINYLNYRGWNLDFNFFSSIEEKVSEDKDLGVSDKFNLVMSVARKVQNVAADVADGLEKIKSALTWRHPPASVKLLTVLFISFIGACILPCELLVSISAMCMGVKLFIVDYIYTRYPRVKRRYDAGYSMWQDLPTDLQYEVNVARSEIEKYIVPDGSSQTDLQALSGNRGDDQITTDDRAFCELFSLPESESPRQDWQGGRRCSLINKDKSLAAAFKSGKLYLTHSFLCFERSKTPSPKNIVIPLADIARLEKSKPYSWLPGGGMAIEINVVGQHKPLVFGGLKNRDELYESICEEGLQKLTEVTKDDASLPWMEGRRSLKRRKPDYGHATFKPFSLANSYTDSD